MGDQMTKRENWVDYAKGIGIILVVYGHVVRGLIKADIIHSDRYFQLIDQIIYSFHMPLFFFLSGLFFEKSFLKKGAKNLLFSKIDTIFYPYVLWSLIQGGIQVGLSTVTNGNKSFLDVLNIWEPQAQFWFLYSLFFIFCTCTIIFKLAQKKSPSILLSVCILAYLVKEQINTHWFIDYIIDFLPYFILGVIFNRHRLIEKIGTIRLLLTCSILFCISQYLFHFIYGRSYGDNNLFSLYLAIVSIFFVSSLSYFLQNIRLRYLDIIGRYSMEIFILHILCGSGVRIILSKIFKIDDIILHLTLGVIVATITPLIISLTLEKLKIKYLFSSKFFVR